MQDRGGFEETIPQLFRQTWQLEGSIQHPDRPHSQASNTCQEEGTNRVKGGNMSRYLIISWVVVELNLWTHRRSMKTLRGCNFELSFI